MKLRTLLGLLILTATCGRLLADAKTEARQFLEFYNATFQSLYAANYEAQWASMTDVTEENTGQRIGAEKTQAAFLGNKFVIERARSLLKQQDKLDALTVRQLRYVLLTAAGSPGTIPDIVGQRVQAEARQAATMDGFEFKWTPPGRSAEEKISVNQIDELLVNSTNMAERLAVWNASKESGVALRDGLVKLRNLRNRVAKEMDFSSYFGLRADWFDMSVPEMKKLTDDLCRQTRPLYEQLHCWAKHRLAQRYGEPAPRGPMPAHWLPNRWSQEWPNMVASVDLDPLVKDRKPEWLVQRAIAYGESLGLPKVPQVFWEKSDLYDLPPDSKRKKNTHASAWHMDLGQGVRSLMSVKSDFTWFTTTHHEMGHIFYDLSYARPEIPMILRDGASPAMHEAMAEALAAPAGQLPYLRETGIVTADMQFDENQWLLNSALNDVVFIPWAAGVMAAWEREFYEDNLPADKLNARWWQLVMEYQGIVPPSPRGEQYCDAATKTHINDNPAEYYKYAIAFAIKYQLHVHIAKKILKQDPRNCRTFGSKEVGAFLYGIMKHGATRDWRELIREATGEYPNGSAMLEYYSPLMNYLKEQNKGRDVGW
jgi:peptidyl-dipeptidase A